MRILCTTLLPYSYTASRWYYSQKICVLLCVPRSLFSNVRTVLWYMCSLYLLQYAFRSCDTIEQFFSAAAFSPAAFSAAAAAAAAVYDACVLFTLRPYS